MCDWPGLDSGEKLKIFTSFHKSFGLFLTFDCLSDSTWGFYRKDAVRSSRDRPAPVPAAPLIRCKRGHDKRLLATNSAAAAAAEQLWHFCSTAIGSSCKVETDLMGPFFCVCVQNNS